jgi:hypothetical protein
MSAMREQNEEQDRFAEDGGTELDQVMEQHPDVPPESGTTQQPGGAAEQDGGGAPGAVRGTADLIQPPTTQPEPDGTNGQTSDATPLLASASEERFRTGWEQVQVGFVDQPRESVQQADQLVAELMQELAQGFAQARSTLEAEWDRGEDVSTEDLRLALQRYRSFFQRLLAA